jgi:hypothetical protein
MYTTKDYINTINFMAIVYVWVKPRRMGSQLVGAYIPSGNARTMWSYLSRVVSCVGIPGYRYVLTFAFLSPTNYHPK